MLVVPRSFSRKHFWRYYYTYLSFMISFTIFCWLFFFIYIVSIQTSIYLYCYYHLFFIARLFLFLKFVVKQNHQCPLWRFSLSARSLSIWNLVASAVTMANDPVKASEIRLKSKPTTAIYDSSPERATYQLPQVNDFTLSRLIRCAHRHCAFAKHASSGRDRNLNFGEFGALRIARDVWASDDSDGF